MPPRGPLGPPPKAPKPAKPAASKVILPRSLPGATPRGTAIPTRPPKPTVNDRAARTLGTGANPRGVAISQHPPGGRGVHQAVKEVFNHQNPQGQARIIRSVLNGKADPSTTRAIRDAWHGLGVDQQIRLNSYLPHSQGVDVGKLLDSVAKTLGRGFTQGTGIGQRVSSKADTSSLGGGVLPGVGTVTPFSGVKKGQTLGGFASNTAQNLWDIGPETVMGLYGVGKDIVTGHEGNAISALTDPFIGLGEDPQGTTYNAPVNAAMMFLGPKAIVGRGAGALMRAGTFGEKAAAAASTAREPLQVGTVAGEGSPIVEARSYSRDVLTKAMQKAHEKFMRSRGRNPNISSPKPRALPQSLAYAFNVGTEAKLRRVADEMTSTRQALGRQERARALHGLMKTAPKGPGRDIVTHVLQGVIRKPETAVEDTVKEINRLKAAQQGKRTVQEIWNRRQAKALDTALKTPGAFDAAFKSAKDLRPHINAQDAALLDHALLTPEQAMRSKLFPYAMAHMGAKFDHVTGKLVKADGTDLPTREILDHLKENNVPDPAYVGHFPGKVSPARFYQAYRLSRGTLGKSRTGKAFLAGAYDHTFEGLAGQVASRSESVIRAGLHDRVINRLGIKLKPDQMRELLQRTGASEDQIKEAVRTGAFTPGEARLIARAAITDDHGNEIPGALHLTPVTMAPRSALAEVHDLQHPSALSNISQLELKALAHAVDDATTRSDGVRNVTLVPTIATRRFADQFAKTDTMLKHVGQVTQQFRRTVLPYSTHWMLQIGSEAALRAMLAGVFDPRYRIDAGRLMERLQDTEAGRAALQETVNATFYNKRDPLAIHNPNPGAISSFAHALPPTRLLLAMHRRYADMIGGAMGSLEHNFRLMALGKFAHQEAQEFAHSWRDAVLLQGKSLDQLATRLKADPALVAKLGRQVDDVFGKYNKFTPMQRMAIQSFMPFLPWYLNAAKYVFWLLPTKHPVSSALLASLRQTMNQDIKDGKQLPLNAWAMQELARISPFGIFTPPSAKMSTGAALGGQQLTGAFLPEAEGSLYNIAGLNSFGDSALKQAPSGANYKGDVKPKSGPALAAALENMLEAFLPGARYAREALEGGRKSYGTSTILGPQPEPGQKAPDLGSIVNRILNPFYSVESAQRQPSAPQYGSSQSASTGSSTGWGGSSSSSSGGWGGSSSSSSAGWG